MYNRALATPYNDTLHYAALKSQPDCNNWAPINAVYREQARLWLPAARPTCGAFTTIGKFKKVDCIYDLEFLGARSEIAEEVVEFVFLIGQQNCSTHVRGIPGGSAFDAFANSVHFLSACTTLDLNNGYYLINCLMPRIGNNASAVSNSNLPPLPAEADTCVRLTVVLMYEHYDAVGETLFEQNQTPQYMPLWLTLSATTNSTVSVKPGRRTIM